jgi:hypothetical protein
MAKKTLFRWNTRELHEAVKRQMQQFPQKAKRAMDGVGGYLNGEVRKRTPVDEGNLTASITNETIEYEGSSATAIYVPSNAPAAEYAVALHENNYNLGENSQLKQMKTGKAVGKKYITRAIDENRGRIVSIIKKEMEL